jgi:hypothetical protein
MLSGNRNFFQKLKGWQLLVTKIIIFLAACLLMTGIIYQVALADRDDHERKSYSERYERDDDDKHKEDDDSWKSRSSSSLGPVNNPTYKEECGACHFCYQPGLLPVGSWDRILAGLDDHFGEVIVLDAESKKIIAAYLTANSADRSSAKRAVKITRSLGGRIPVRITDVPYIREKHHDISSNILNRQSIGSLANCSACHTTAQQGIYEDDNIVIPR